MGNFAFMRTYKARLRKPGTNREVAEAFEMLLFSLNQNKNEWNGKVLLFTSTQPNEGKTTAAINLAFAAARKGRKVLLIDADLRSPAIHHVLSLTSKHGLAEVLSGKIAFLEVVQSLDLAEGRDGKASLDIITAGNVTRLEITPLLVYLGNENLLRVSAEAYDYVLVDSPPILVGNDALLLAPAVDGALFVIEAGSVKGQDALRAKERLERAGTPIVGVILNRFDERRFSGLGRSAWEGDYGES